MSQSNKFNTANKGCGQAEQGRDRVNVNGKPKLTVYYDGACPRCVKDRCNYQRLAGGRGLDVEWFDITGQEEKLREIGIDPHKALTELHVSDEKQRVFSELDAYIVLMGKLPVLKPLAWLIGLPFIKPVLGRFYRQSVLARLRRSGRLPKASE